MASKRFKNRKVDVYLPSENDLEVWMARAKAAGVSLSRYVYETIEAAADKKPASVPAEYLAEMQDLKVENARLHVRLDEYERREAAARLSSGRSSQDLEKFRELQRYIISYLTTDDSYKDLNNIKKQFIDKQDTESLKHIGEFINELQDIGLVTAATNGRGYRWSKFLR